jgi:hypothetical protein
MWTIFAPVLPDPASPRGQKMPGLYEADFETQLNFGRTVFPHIVPPLLDVILARHTGEFFGAGSMGKGVIPTVSVYVQCSKNTAKLLASALGYTAQLAGVHTIRDASFPDGRIAIDLVPVEPMPPDRQRAFAQQLVEREPALGAPAPRLVAGAPTWRFVDHEDRWTPQEVDGFRDSADALARQWRVRLYLDRLIIPAM